MSVPLLHVDAFTGEAFAGNPAAVCILGSSRPAAWMQSVANDMNLSETAFVVPAREAWGLRWFTPEAEVELCGHATLATAHALWDTGRAPADRPLEFETASGVLVARPDDHGIALDFPATPASEAAAPPGLLEALGVMPTWIGTTRFDALVEVADAETVRGLRPDMAMLRSIEVRGIAVTARADDDEHDFVSRFFAPAVGVDEDPVTGSAHCALGPYWAGKLGRDEVVGYQASSRGGTVRVRMRDDRVDLVGRAVTVVRGELVV